ncbi:ribosomal protein L15, putative, partial [Eimeria maxima]
RRKRWEPLNLAKVRRFLEQGRLDHRYPITQRHLHDSGCVRVRNGVHLFNVARPGLEAIHYLEKMRARGCLVFYPKPQWLEREEKTLKRELEELWAERDAAEGNISVSPPRAADLQALGVYRAKGFKDTTSQDKVSKE